MIRAAALLTTLALTATACTLYIDTDDDDHIPWQPSQDAGSPSSDAAPWEDSDASPYYPDAGLQVDAEPIPQDACGVP
jgi:hypothetical protein